MDLHLDSYFNLYTLQYGKVWYDSVDKQTQTFIGNYSL